MRVIAGTAKSLPLKTPDGLDTRPTTDRIKETLFNMLQALVPDSVFLDLFSGSGGIGIEALSRGAAHCYFVENNRKAFSCIQHNVEFVGFTDRATLMKQDVLGALPMIREKEADIIFMDPPYQSDYAVRVLEALAKKEYVTGQTLIVVETEIEKDFSFAEALGYNITREKLYKTNKHVFLEKQGE